MTYNFAMHVIHVCSSKLHFSRIFFHRGNNLTKLLGFSGNSLKVDWSHLLGEILNTALYQLKAFFKIITFIESHL